MAVWASLWVGLNVADAMTTANALDAGHSEFLPWMAWLNSFDIMGFAVVKIGLVVAVVAILWRLKRLYLLKPLCVILGVIVLWNMSWII